MLFTRSQVAFSCFAAAWCCKQCSILPCVVSSIHSTLDPNCFLTKPAAKTVHACMHPSVSQLLCDIPARSNRAETHSRGSRVCEGVGAWPSCLDILSRGVSSAIQRGRALLDSSMYECWVKVIICMHHTCIAMSADCGLQQHTQ